MINRLVKRGFILYITAEVLKMVRTQAQNGMSKNRRMYL